MAVSRTLSRWFLPLAAVVAVGVTLAFAAVDPNHSFAEGLVEGAFTFGLAGVLFAVGTPLSWTVARDRRPARCRRYRRRATTRRYE